MNDLNSRLVAFVMVIWFSTSLALFPLLFYQVYISGFQWIYSTPQGLLTIGLTAAYSYLLVSVSSVSEEAKKQRERSERLESKIIELKEYSEATYSMLAALNRDIRRRDNL